MARPPIGATSGLDNPGVYQRLKEARKAVARSDAGRVTKARVDAAKYQFDHQYAAHPPKDPEPESEPVEKNELRPQVRADDESAQWRYGPVGVSLGGYSGLVDERIEAARAAGAFRNNPLRGKALARDLHEHNPYLRREEYLMNRLVQRQGAAPPWVEANSDLDSSINSFRKRLAADWVHHAARTITSGYDDPGAIGGPLSDSDPIPTGVVDALPDSLEGVDIKALPAITPSVQDDAERLHSDQRDKQPASIASLVAQTRSPEQALDALHTYYLSRYIASLNSDQAEYPPNLRVKDSALTQTSQLLPPARERIAMLWARTTSFRDPAWEKRNEAMHLIELASLNQKIMRYNALAPFAARRGLVTRPAELERAWSATQARLAIAVSNELRLVRSPEGRRAQAALASSATRSPSSLKPGMLARFATWLDSSSPTQPTERTSPSAGGIGTGERRTSPPTEEEGLSQQHPPSITALDSLIVRFQRWGF